MIGDEVKAFETEDLGWREDCRNLHPIEGGSGELQRVKANRVTGACHAGGDGEMGHPMTCKTRMQWHLPHGRHQLSVRNLADK